MIKNSKCSVVNCENKVRTRNLCNKHYQRYLRTGTTHSPKDYKVEKVYNEGYVLLYKNHPMANSRGHVREHRKVLFDAIGKGKHTCHWCGTILNWDKIVVDHLNSVRDDNRVENLVVSCNKCNIARGGITSMLNRVRPEQLEQLIQQMRQDYEKIIDKRGKPI